jgi:hypothetical protein
MDATRILRLLGGVVIAGGIATALLIHVGGVRTCVEFAGCHTDYVGIKVTIALSAIVVGGILLAVARSRGNRWRGDARYWKPAGHS